MGSRRARRKKLGLAKVEDVSLRSHDASSGTPTYAFNQFRGNMLTCLLNDLLTLEKCGLEKSYCSVVQKSLGCFVHATTEVPSGGMLTGALFPVVETFEKTYREWNNIEGDDDKAIKERRQSLGELRKARQKITNKTRRLQFEISNDLDVVVLKSGYNAIGELITLAPSVFKNLTAMHIDFEKKGGLDFA